MHRALDGEAPLPLEWVLSRLCEEFHCLPSAAWAEYLRLPAGMLETILLLRSYGRAKAVYDGRGKTKHEPPLTDAVMENDFALVAEELRK